MSEIRQRWRVVFARDEEARYLSHLDAVTLWERALRRGGVPLATTEGHTPRPRLVFGAPLQLGMLAEHELADLFLCERLAAPEFRRRLAAGAPPGYRILEAHDVWVGAPALAPQLVAADYRLLLLGPDEEALSAAAASLMSADRLPRERRREARTIVYDLRPLLFELRARPDPRPVQGRGAGSAGSAGTPDEAGTFGVAPENNGSGPVGGFGKGPTATLWMRLRHSQEEGSGRPDEVVAAVAERLGMEAPPRFDGVGSARGSGRRPRGGEGGPRGGEGGPGGGEAAPGESGVAAPGRSPWASTNNAAESGPGDAGAGPAASGMRAPDRVLEERGSRATAPGYTPGGPIEVLRAVRERMWLAEELNPSAPAPPERRTAQPGDDD